MNLKSDDTSSAESATLAAPKKAAAATLPTTLEEWVAWLQDQEMPIFSRTVQRLNAAAQDRRAGVMEISRIILEDPSLTAKLLKLSNSTYYNPSRQNLATVTRAMVVIGLTPICDLAIACSFIETILNQRNKDRVNQEIARSLHAAVQAKALAVMCKDPVPEEVFIAALLHNIGHIAFWCFEQEQGERIGRLIDERQMDADQAEKEVLGFKLKQLGSALGKTWKLGGLIGDTFSTGAPSTRRSEYVRLGCEVARLSAKNWEDPELHRIQLKMAEITGHPLKEIEALVKSNTGNAVKLANQFGAAAAVPFIPKVEKSLIPGVEVESEQETPGKEEVQEDKNQVTVLQVVQEISNALASDFNLNLVFQMIIEGIYLSLRMDRVLFALMTPDRRFLKEKSSLGWPETNRQSLLQIPAAGVPENLFAHTVNRNQAIWARKEASHPLYERYTPWIATHMGSHECLISPFGLNNKVIGCFYADRAFHHEPMNQAIFEAFKQITQQANIALKLSQLQS